MNGKQKVFIGVLLVFFNLLLYLAFIGGTLTFFKLVISIVVTTEVIIALVLFLAFIFYRLSD